MSFESHKIGLKVSLIIVLDFEVRSRLFLRHCVKLQMTKSANSQMVCSVIISSRTYSVSNIVLEFSRTALK